MATPYVPVPMPIGNSASSFTTNRNQRSSSFGSVSTSSNSSKGQLEDSNMGNYKQTSVPDQVDSIPSVCSSPLIRTKFTGTESSIEYSARPRESEEQNPEGVSWEDRPSTPTILGYEVMEERAKFTVYKILVKKTPEESWVVFRRYTDFSRLNDKLKEMFPGFRLALPPKRWFKDNYNADFLENRQLGLQAFLQNLVAHKDIANCLAVREFLCLDDPPGPFDSLEESRAFCETLEETNYRLQKELLEKQKEVESLKKLLHEKQLHIDTIENRIRNLSIELEESLYMSGTEGGQILTVQSCALASEQGILDEESRANNMPCLSHSELENPVSEIEVAEVAYYAEED
ncbi:PREDICTED: sorting nexin-16 isoform X1 [Elephantulus edwardii]|uniref:sorting nexin-16 isoform X1 n=1 Tax=Elephantulus edwardii TaxID=28737 RepID=UPI0003F0DDBE|nr:PREDICTED: sorting nexin-16 isoform X1 [Elephantulus edwardii]